MILRGEMSLGMTSWGLQEKLVVFSWEMLKPKLILPLGMKVGLGLEGAGDQKWVGDAHFWDAGI